MDMNVCQLEMSNLILNYKDISIYSRDLSLFVNGQWLNDVCINFCFARKQDEIDNSSILLMDPSIVSFLTFQVSDEDEMNELVVGLNLSDRKWIIVPVNDCSSLGGSSSHWSLMVCHIESGFTAHFDSSNHYNAQSSQTIAEKLSCLLQRDRPIKVHEMKTPQQKNGYDCGIYCVLFAYCIVDFIKSSGTLICPDTLMQEAASEMDASVTPCAVTDFRLRCMNDIEMLSRNYLLSKVAHN